MPQQKTGRRRMVGLNKRQHRAGARQFAPDPDTLAVSVHLRENMLKKGITAHQLATAAGLDPTVVYSYLDPARYGIRTMNLRSLRAFADTLDVKLHQLMPPD
jgi:hypothetical protein